MKLIGNNAFQMLLLYQRGKNIAKNMGMSFVPNLCTNFVEHSNSKKISI